MRTSPTTQATRHQDPQRLPPHVVQLFQELLVHGHVPELTRVIFVLLQRPVRRAGANELHAFRLEERQISSVTFSDEVDGRTRKGGHAWQRIPLVPLSRRCGRRGAESPASRPADARLRRRARRRQPPDRACPTFWPPPRPCSTGRAAIRSAAAPGMPAPLQPRGDLRRDRHLGCRARKPSAGIGSGPGTRRVPRPRHGLTARAPRACLREARACARSRGSRSPGGARRGGSWSARPHAEALSTPTAP
jgi:hypothetical protein